MPRTLATIRSLFLAASVNVMLIVPSTTSCIAFCPQEDIAGRSIDACCEITGDPDSADDPPSGRKGR